jgi:hypothetical protein
MQPRGQLWFALQRICDDFRDFSGLSEREATQTLVLVLRNLLADQETALARLEQTNPDSRNPTSPDPV